MGIIKELYNPMNKDLWHVSYPVKFPRIRQQKSFNFWLYITCSGVMFQFKYLYHTIEMENVHGMAKHKQKIVVNRPVGQTQKSQIIMLSICYHHHKYHPTRDP